VSLPTKSGLSYLRIFELAFSMGTAMLIRTPLSGVRAWNALTLANVTVLPELASMAASFLPARRATSVNPTVANVRRIVIPSHVF
jgi:ABC-type lipoprotein release transport system permease subunit